MSLETNLTSGAQHVQKLDEPLKGIGGWLVLVAIGQIIGVIKVIVSTVEYYTGPGVHEAFEKLSIAMNAELTLNATYIALVIFTTYAFFSEKRYFRILYILEILLSPILIIVDAMLLSLFTTLSFSKALDTDLLARTVGACLPGTIWIIYMFRSRRVKNTFVN
jgi:hypothetical protein